MATPMYFPPAPFDLGEAVTCSGLVDTAYAMYRKWINDGKPDRDAFQWAPPPDSPFTFGSPIWGNSKVFILNDWEPFALVAKRGTGAWAIIRGTESPEDWCKDLDAKQRAFDLPNISNGGKVHCGFFDLYLTFRDELLGQLNALTGIDKLTITGHSLGASLAMLACPDLVVNAFPGSAKTTIQYNLAGPRTGDSTFAALCNDGPARTYRIVNACDIVPEVPPPVYADLIEGKMVYTHVGTQVTYAAQYDSVAGNHSYHDSYHYALTHPDQPQGPLP